MGTTVSREEPSGRDVDTHEAAQYESAAETAIEGLCGGGGNSAADGIADGSGRGVLGRSGDDADFDGAGSSEGGERSSDAPAAENARAERAFLNAVVRDVRKRSGSGLLTVPSRWAELGIVPGHLTAEDAEMLVYDRVKICEKRAAASPVPERPVYRCATRAVGIPRRIREAQGADEDGSLQTESRAMSADTAAASRTPASVPSSVCATGAESCAGARKSAGTPSESGRDDAENPLLTSPDRAMTPDGEDGACATLPGDGQGSLADFEPFDLTVGGVRGRVVLVEGDPTFVPYEETSETDEEPDFTDVALIQGRYTYYLYAKDKMTDAFANWSFLAAEADDAAVLATLARQESKIYPRPFHDASLKNFPFLFDDERIERAWEDVRESGAYPDIQETFASNGDRYFYSTEHLAPRRASALAEWHSVTIYENL